jgi:hypothetical protein
MKIFKSLALVAGMTFVTANISAQAPTTAPAQGQHGTPNPDQMAQKATANIKTNVTGITPDQESKILAANTDFAKGMIAARQSNNGDRDAMHTQMQTLKDSRDAKMKTILTADQYAQYQKMAPMHQGGGRPSGN